MTSEPTTALSTYQNFTLSKCINLDSIIVIHRHCCNNVTEFWTYKLKITFISQAFIILFPTVSQSAISKPLGIF